MRRASHLHTRHTTGLPHRTELAEAIPSAAHTRADTALGSKTATEHAPPDVGARPTSRLHTCGRGMQVRMQRGGRQDGGWLKRVEGFSVKGLRSIQSTVQGSGIMESRG
eukprot:362130-Chlamydomonas_euryale.AAC.3